MLVFLTFLSPCVVICFVCFKLLSSSCTQTKRWREDGLVPTLPLGPSSLKVLRYGDSGYKLLPRHPGMQSQHMQFVQSRDVSQNELLLCGVGGCWLVTLLFSYRDLRFFFQSPYSFCLCECQFGNRQRSIHLSRNQNEAVGVNLRTHPPFPHPSEVSLSTVGRTGCLELKF